MNEIGLRGLDNNGNTCYLNSVLQSLFQCKKLVMELMESKHKLIEPLFKDFYYLIEVIWFQDIINNTINPLNFKNILADINKLYDNNLQHDAHECFIDILDIFTNELIKNKIVLEITPDKNFKSVFKEKYTYIHDIFYGLYETVVICENNHKTTTLEPFVDLSLAINNGDNLLELIDNFETNETLSGEDQFYCDKCQQYINANKWIGINKYPNNILIIHFKRFDSMDKIDKNINYPLTLYKQDKTYHLFAIINHIGNLFMGHYYTYIKHINDKWYEMNDSNIMDLDMSQVINNDKAYILFYQIE